MEEYEVDLRDYIRVIWREKWIILAVFVAAVAAALGLSLNMPHQYATQTMLLITPRLSEALAGTSGKGETSPIVGATFSAATYESLATANDLLQEIIGSLKLKTSVESLKGIMRPSIEKGQEPPLLTMTVKGDDPGQIKEIANKWAELFIQRSTKLLATSTAQSYDFISQAFQETERSLKAEEEAEKEYKQANPLEVLQSEVTVLTNKYQSFLSQLQDKRLALVEKRAELLNIAKELEKEPQFLELERSISNEAIWNLLGNNPSLRALKAIPNLKVTDQQLNSIYTSLKSQLGQTRISVNSLQSEVSYLEGQTAEFKKELDEKLSKLTEVQLTLSQMDRGITTLKSTYQMLSSKLQEASIAKQESASSIKVVESAVAPQVPIGPNKKMNVIVAGVLGLFVGVLLAFFKHYMAGGAEESKEPKEEVKP